MKQERRKRPLIGSALRVRTIRAHCCVAALAQGPTLCGAPRLALHPVSIEPAPFVIHNTLWHLQATKAVTHGSEIDDR